MQTTNVGDASPEPPRLPPLDRALFYLADQGLIGPTCFLLGLAAIVVGVDAGIHGRLKMESAGSNAHGAVEAIVIRLQDPSLLDRAVIALPWTVIGLFVCTFALDLVLILRPGADGGRFRPLSPKRSLVASGLAVLSLLAAVGVQYVPRAYFGGDGIQALSDTEGAFSLLLLTSALHALTANLVRRGAKADDELEGLV